MVINAPKMINAKRLIDWPRSLLRATVESVINFLMIIVLDRCRGRSNPGR